MRLFFYSEDLTYPFDEGIKKTAKNIIQTLMLNNDVVSCSKYGMNNATLNQSVIRTNKFFLNIKLFKLINSHKPKCIIYLPSSSATFPSFFRLKVLRLFYSKAKIIMIILQPKYLSLLKLRLISIFKFYPDIALTPSSTVEKQFKSYQINVKFIPLFTNINNFSPVNNIKINRLRERFGIPSEKFIITHIGHINSGRNLEALIPLQSEGNQVVIVSSSSTPDDSPKDPQLKSKLLNNGILILDYYIKDIHSIYHLSDLYIFPVISEGGCIGLPLTILEAIACNTLVLTTNYASIKRIFKGSHKFLIISDHENFHHEVKKIKISNKNYSIDGQSIINKINNKFESRLKNAIR